MYSNDGLSNEFQRLAHHRRVLFTLITQTPRHIDAGCVVSGYIEHYRNSRLYPSLERIGTDLCDRFGMRLCSGHGYK